MNYKGAAYGIHDLVSVVETYSRDVKPDKSYADRIIEVIEARPTKFLCLMRNKVIRHFERAKVIAKTAESYGLRGRYGNTVIFAVPFPTGSKLTKEAITEKHHVVWTELAKVL